MTQIRVIAMLEKTMSALGTLSTVLSIAACLLSWTCDSPTGAEAPSGSRNYVWAVDTIQMTMNHLSSMWGSSPTDIWAGGAGGTGWDRLLHYDGTRWTALNEYIASTVNTIYGFNAADVWIGGQEGKIWHFDGSHWTESFLYHPGGFVYASIENICGTTSSDIYAVGLISYNDSTLRGFILHYDGTRWNEAYRASFPSQFEKVRVEGGIAYVWGTQISLTASDTDEIYLFDGSNLKEIYSGAEDVKGLTNINDIGGHVYCILSHDVCRYKLDRHFFSTGDNVVTGSFVKQFSIESPYFEYNVTGHSMSDAYALMHNGLGHWNGTDMKYLVTFSPLGVSPYEPMCFTKEVFFCGVDVTTGSSLVFHGKLTE